MSTTDYYESADYEAICPRCGEPPEWKTCENCEGQACWLCDGYGGYYTCLYCEEFQLAQIEVAV